MSKKDTRMWTITKSIEQNSMAAAKLSLSQFKCLQWLREKYCELVSEDQKFVDRALSGTGVEMLFVGSIGSRLY